MTFFAIARGIHIAAGVTALATFWLPMVTKKGGRLHRRVGWVPEQAQLERVPRFLNLPGVVTRESCTATEPEDWVRIIAE